MIDRELLSFLQRNADNGKLDVEAVKQYIEIEERKELLKQHKHRIWQGKNGRFFTYIYDDDKKRKLLSKATMEQLEDSIIENVKRQGNYFDDNIFVDICKEWLEQKLYYNEFKKGSYDRYMTDVKRFFADSEIGSKPISNITEYELEKFIKSSIKSFNLTAKSYGNIRTLIVGTFKFAKRKGINVIRITEFFEDISIPNKMFNKSNEKWQVFNDYELKKIHNHIKDNQDILNLGVALAFLTGLRAGELSALKPEDIKGNTIHVQRMEQRQKDNKGKCFYSVVDETKTQAGNRTVVVTDECLKVIEKIRSLNPHGEYLLMENGIRYIGKKYTVRLYQLCNKLGIPKRSLHKARKTYCTKLINAGVDKSIILAQVGHTDIKTTENYYLFNNKTNDEILKQVDKALAI